MISYVVPYLVGVVLGLALFLVLGWHAREADRLRAARGLRDRLARFRDTFVCARCARRVSVDEGAHDCQPEVCDDCWFVLHQRGDCAACAEDEGGGQSKSERITP